MITKAQLDAHVDDTSAAHAASAISVSSTTLSGTGTDVQASLEEIDNLLDDHSSRHEDGGADEISLTGLSGAPADTINKTIVDAKGDLIVATAADTVARLPVGGTDGHVLTVDAAQAAGVKWAASGGGISLDDVYKALSPGDKPPSSPGAKDDEFDDSSLDAKWSWRNQGGATAVESSFPGALLLTAPANSGGALRILEQTAPSTPYTVTVKFTWAPQFLNFHDAGLVFVNNSSGKIVSAQVQLGGTPSYQKQIIRYTNATTFSAAPVSLGVLHGDNQYFRVVNDGTTLSFYFSADGMSWLLYGTETLATFVGSIDRIGIFAETQSSTVALQVAFRWFRVT